MVVHFEQMAVEVSQDPAGCWNAWEKGTYDCDYDSERGFFPTCKIGSGSTMIEAIVDLREKME